MKKALFNIGQRVEYIGKREASSGEEGKMKPSIFPSMVATITDRHDPEKGLGHVKLKSGDIINDRNSDGYNTYKNEFGNKALIWPRDKKDWEKI